MERGLYIHIPFCDNICAYCDFAKFFYNENLVDQYLDALINEIEDRKCQNVCSIYIGGGTPSSLNINQLEKLLSYLNTNYYKKDIPFTIEANCENLSEEKIILFNKYGVNRVSLGVQSFNDELIKRMNRKHNFDTVVNTISLLKKHHIDNISCDLIYGLPNETKEILLDDIKKLINLDIKHISTYALQVSKHTVLYNQKVKEASEDKYREFYDLIVEELFKNGFSRYEVSNFSKPGYESYHNLIYWLNKEYYGVGLGASSYIDSVRFDNTRSLNKYLTGERVLNKEELDIEDKEFYELMLGLRLSKGININEFNNKYNKDILFDYIDKLDSLFNRGLIELKNNHIRITDNNVFIMDYVLKELLF